MKPKTLILLYLDGPDAERALAELRSNIEYDKLDVGIEVCPDDELNVVAAVLRAVVRKAKTYGMATN